MNRVNNTRFLSQDELAKQLKELKLSEKNFEVGGIPLLTKNGSVYVDGSDSHTIVYGATGSKKTRMFVIPSVEIFGRAGESFIVTDPKGEIFGKTAGDMEALGYEVQCLNLRNLDCGLTWNPLAIPYDYYVRGRRERALEMISEFAASLFEDMNQKDAFWKNHAKDVIIGFVLLMFELENRDSCHVRNLLQLWNEYTNNRRGFLDKVKGSCEDELLITKLNPLDSNADATIGSIEAMVTMGLNKLVINEKLLDMLSFSGYDMQHLVKNKTAMYLILPDENKYYHFIASLFISQTYEVLVKHAQEDPDNRLARRMNYLIDEFANIPKIENMDSMITAARSRNIRFHLIVQSMRQLSEKYGEGAEIICGNCNNWVFLYSKEFQLLQEISRLCGTVIYDNNMSVPLISEFELQHLNKEEGEALVLSGRNFPCITNLADVDEYSFEYRKSEKFKDLRKESAPAVVAKKFRQYRGRKKQDESLFNISNITNTIIRLRGLQNEKYELLYGYVYGVRRGMIIASGPASFYEYEKGIAQARLADQFFGMMEEYTDAEWFFINLDQVYDLREKYLDEVREGMDYFFAERLQGKSQDWCLEKVVKQVTAKKRKKKGHNRYQIIYDFYYNYSNEYEPIEEHRVLAEVELEDKAIDLLFLHHFTLALANKEMGSFREEFESWITSGKFESSDHLMTYQCRVCRGWGSGNYCRVKIVQLQ